MSTTLRFKSAKPEITLDLEVVPSFGGLQCRLVGKNSNGTDRIDMFVIAGRSYLEKCLTSDLKTNKGDTVTCRFTWTDSPNGFNYHLARADATTLLNYCKEHNHV